MIEVPEWEIRHPTAPGFITGFLTGRDAWSWRDREILRLEALLSDSGLGAGVAGPQAGPHAAGSDGHEDAAGRWLSLLQTDDGVNLEALRQFMTTMVSTPELLDSIRDLEVAGQLSSLIEQAHRRRGLNELVEVIEDSESTRDQLRVAVRRQPWVFGGRYIPPFATAEIPALSQIPLPLMRTDGAIHVIEVGRANVPDLIAAHSGPDRRYGVGVEVQESVNRAINQLRILDEVAEPIRRVMRLETRRALATVVIGHRRYLADEDQRVALPSTLRTYSSHLAGIDLVSYDELVYSAERALAIDEPAADPV